MTKLQYPPQFAIGPYRPIYLWAGPGTIRMNRLKFPNAGVDEYVHLAAHTPQGADRVVNEMHCNWVHLTYNWGFPPEIEQEDWDAFEQAATAYHQAGVKVFAYIQSSNCVYAGSFRHEDWYAKDPRGKKIPYIVYDDRYMACLDDPEWRHHLRETIRGAITRGADGIFCDNPFQGAQPASLFGAWLGPAGCHCSRCQDKCLQETGQPMPVTIQTRDPRMPRFLQWRANQVTRLLADMAAYARELQPGIPFSANNVDCILKDSYVIYGIDLKAMRDTQDVTLIENFALPRWEAQPAPRLTNNALQIRTARAIVGTRAHLSILSYDIGIGFDPVYPARRYRQGIAEAAACGTSMTTKGTEYFDGEKMTLLTAAEYAPTVAALGEYHTWLEANAGTFTSDRQHVAPVGLLYPGESLWLDWHRVAPLYYGAGQALTIEGIPWQVVDGPESILGLRAVLVFDEEARAAVSGASGVTPILVPELEHWSPSAPSPIGKSRLLQSVAASVCRAATTLYTKNRIAQRLMNWLGLPSVITQSALYRVPSEAARMALLNALPDGLYPRLKAQQPVLIEVWEKDDQWQVHLVNYATQPQEVRVQFPSPVAVRVVSPDHDDTITRSGVSIDIPIDVYQILLVTPLASKEGSQ